MIIDICEVSDRIIGVKSIELFFAPAVREPPVGRILVAENLNTCLVGFICEASVLIIIPTHRLRLAVGQGKQIPGRIVGITDQFVVGVGLKGLARAFIIGIKISAHGVGEGHQAPGGVAEFLSTAVRLGARAQPVEIIVRVCEGDAIGIREPDRAIFDIIDRGFLGPNVVINRREEALVICGMSNAEIRVYQVYNFANSVLSGRPPAPSMCFLEHGICLPPSRFISASDSQP